MPHWSLQHVHRSGLCCLLHVTLATDDVKPSGKLPFSQRFATVVISVRIVQIYTLKISPVLISLAETNFAVCLACTMCRSLSLSLFFSVCVCRSTVFNRNGCLGVKKLFSSFFPSFLPSCLSVCFCVYFNVCLIV